MRIARIGWLLLVLSISSVAAAETEWSMGISAGPEGIRGFHLAIGNYYRVPEREVVVVRDRGIPDEELPIVFFLAGRARVQPVAIISLRSKGWSWHDITLHFGLTPEIFYVPIIVRKGGPPYGPAYGHYKKYPRESWAKVKLSDREIVNQVNLNFISKHYGYDPAEIMREREQGASFVNIEQAVSRRAGERHSGKDARTAGGPDGGWNERDRKGPEAKEEGISFGHRRKMKD